MSVSSDTKKLFSDLNKINSQYKEIIFLIDKLFYKQHDSFIKMKIEQERK